MATEHPLKVWRINKGLSQMAMARSLKVSLVTIQFWETGLSMPSPENMTKLHRLTGITRKELEQARE